MVDILVYTSLGVAGHQSIQNIRSICMLRTLYILHANSSRIAVCYFRLTREIKLYSRHFLKHFDLLTALWRLPFEHVAVVGFWGRGEFRQRRTAAAVCRTELHISSYSLD